MSIAAYQELIKEYKLKISSRYVSISPDSLERIVIQERYLVSTKYDGHFYGLVYAEGKCYFINPKGKRVEGLAINTAVESELQGKVKDLCLVGELYVRSEERSRSFNLTKALTDKSADIQFAAFDILSKEGEEIEGLTAFERFEEIKKYATGTSFHAVDGRVVDSRATIGEKFEEAIEQNEEGIVVKGEGPVTYKIKPKYTFDGVVVGFAEGDGRRAGMLRDLLMAFMMEDGSYQVFAHLSHGFGDEQRKELLQQLQKKVVDSDYVEIAANKVGFQMVKPELVVEFSCLDVINEDSKGLSIEKANLSYSESDGYTFSIHRPSVSVTIPVFLRFREDKKVNTQDVRFSQVEEVVSFDTKKKEALKELPKSELVRREVYVKESKNGKMIRKFILYKTNKQEFGSHPAYVFHLTDFSAGRKDPIKRELRLSNDEAQINKIYNEYIEKNIKKGWEQV